MEGAIMAAEAKRAVLYLRVSTGGQTVANQRRELVVAAKQRGWTITAAYTDAGISGAKGWDKHPGLDAMLKDATRGKFDVVMCWAVDRMGRSLPNLIGTLQNLHGAKVDLFLHQQALDTTTPAGRAMFSMLGVFAEFERAMIRACVNTGLARAREAGTKFGRPKVKAEVEAAIRARLATGDGVLKVAKGLGVGVSTVHRVRAEMAETTASGAT
jgi:DNA invertase Pin-like site-specific DNA recombinase